MSNEIEDQEKVRLLIQAAKDLQIGNKVLECREASMASHQYYIPCAKPATRFILSERGTKVYPMCAGCASHNVRNRGNVDVGPVTAEAGGK